MERSSQNCSVKRLFTQCTTEGLPEEPLGRWHVSVSATHVSHPNKILLFLTTGGNKIGASAAEQEGCLGWRTTQGWTVGDWGAPVRSQG